MKKTNFQENAIDDNIADVIETEELTKVATEIITSDNDSQKQQELLFDTEAITELVKKEIADVDGIFDYEADDLIKSLQNILIKNHSRISTILINKQETIEDIISVLGRISNKSNSQELIEKYNSLYDFAGNLCTKPTTSDGRWVSYDECHENLQNIYLIAELLEQYANYLEYM